KATSSAHSKPGERPPGRARDGSSARPAARFRGGSHEPDQAQGQVLPGLKPEFGDVIAGVTLTPAHGNSIFFTVVPHLALMGGVANGKADTIHVNSGSPCLPLP
ncbi:unnamed protein product, partial [Prunus brigantina]